jgi:hypothetical protein
MVDCVDHNACKSLLRLEPFSMYPSYRETNQRQPGFDKCVSHVHGSAKFDGLGTIYKKQ